MISPETSERPTLSRQELLEGLEEQFHRLEAEVDAFSLTLERLSIAREAHRVNRKSSEPLLSTTRVHGTGHARGSTRTTSNMCLGEIMCNDVGDKTTWLLVAMLFMLAATTLFLQWWRQRKEQNRLVRSPEPGRTAKHDPCDVAFLGHPSSVLSTFALWMPETRPLHRWEPSWWMIPLWPLTLVISLWNIFISPLMCGPYFVVDTFRYGGTENQVWLSRAFGYQFMIKGLRRRIARGIEEAVRHADRTGVSVMGLGALNKAEFINHGGEDILSVFQPTKTRLVHGNTLTAAVVVENIKTAMFDGGTAARRSGRQKSSSGIGEKQHGVFMTGATSKVGRAVALKLAMEGFDVICCTRSDDRFKALQTELFQLRRRALRNRAHFEAPGSFFRAAHDTYSSENTPYVDAEKDFVGKVAVREQGGQGTQGRLLRARRVDEGVYHRVWVVGKSDPSVRQHLPLNAAAVVFAVPCPLEGYRPDVKVTNGGILRMDETACTPRRFHILLPHDQVYACHAGAVVHWSMSWMHHEIGKVNVSRMDMTLQASRACGFTIPQCRNSAESGHGIGSRVAIAFAGALQSKATAAAVALPDDGNEAKDRKMSLTIEPYSPDGGNRSLPHLVGPTADHDWINAREGRQPTSSFFADNAPADYGWCQQPGDGDLQDLSESAGLLLPRPSPAVGCNGRSVRLTAAASTGSGKADATVRTAAAVAAGTSWGPSTFSIQRVPTSPPRRPRRAIPCASADTAHTTAAGGDGQPLCFLPPEPEIMRIAESSLPERTARVCRPAKSALPDFCRVLVVGAGASGLSAAACLKRRGEEGVLILERASSVGGSWAAQYEGLKITTRRTHCGLPGWPVPHEGFCERGDGEMLAPEFLRYLRGYCQRFDLDVATDTEVLSVGRERSDGGREFVGAAGGVIRVRIRRGSIAGAAEVVVLRCAHLVVATGKASSPVVPTNVLHMLQNFSGEILHSSKVSGLATLARRRVCIVGMGNSACDLAIALLEHGAGKVHISTRSAPPIIMREWGPLSLEWTSRMVQYMHPRIVDGVVAAFGVARWGKGWRARIFPKGLQQTWHASSSGRIPSIDKGSLVPALLDGRIEVHGCVEHAERGVLHFQHSGAVEAFDVVILATGFVSTHEQWIDDDLARGGANQGVHLLGFNNGRALLPLRQIGKEAEELSARISPRQLVSR